MKEQPNQKIIRFAQGKMEQAERKVVEEYPLRLRVNGRDLATLVCSPQRLNFLLVGFFAYRDLSTASMTSFPWGFVMISA